MKILSAIVLSGLLSGCVVYPNGSYTASYAVEPAVVYEPDVYVGDYYVGFFRPGFGYWTGYGWDINFYAVGHPGYGHYYRGAPRGAWGAYRGGGHYRGGFHRR